MRPRLLPAALLAGFALLALPTPALPATPTPTPLPPQLVFEAPPALAPVAARLRALGPGNLAAAMRLLGLTEPGPPIRVILAREGSDLAKNVPPWISGYALGDLGVVVLLPGREPS